MGNEGFLMICYIVEHSTALYNCKQVIACGDLLFSAVVKVDLSSMTLTQFTSTNSKLKHSHEIPALNIITIMWINILYIIHIVCCWYFRNMSEQTVHRAHDCSFGMVTINQFSRSLGKQSIGTLFPPLPPTHMGAHTRSHTNRHGHTAHVYSPANYCSSTLTFHLPWKEKL